MGEEEDKGARTTVQKGSTSGKAPLVEPRDLVHCAAGRTECNHLGTINSLSLMQIALAAPFHNHGYVVRGTHYPEGSLGEPGLRSSGHFLVNSDLPPAVTRAVYQEVCNPENLNVGEYLNPRDNARSGRTECNHLGTINSLSLKQISLAAPSRNHGYVVRGTHYPEGSLGEPGLRSSGHFLVNSDLPPAVTRAVHQDVCNSENLHVGEYLNPRSGDRDNASSHHVIEHHGRTVKGGHFFSEQDPSSSSSKAMHQAICRKEVTDVLREIAARLPCHIDVVQMARSGPAWAAALREVGFHVSSAHPRLPWLRMPHPTGPIFFCISCSGDATVQHAIRIVEDQRWTRYIGAFEGLWMVAAGHQIGGNMIFNLRSGASFRIPNEAIQGESVQQLILLATTLSTAPDRPECIGMAIAKYMANLQQSRRLVFFTPGRETAIDHFPEEYFDEPEDLTYHESSFWLLTTNEHIHQWDMALQPDGDITLEKWHSFFFPEYLDHGDYVVGRYLVHSRGELLMVVRLSSSSYAAGGETSKFCVYKMTVVQMGKGENEPARCRWTELSSLAGRMLFIGRGCSRCYEASDYPSLTEGLYFSDGRTSFYAEGIMNNLDTPCSDNGRWSTQGPIVRCFPREYHFSSYSSSGWVLQ